jgi:hypothetical protein
MTPDAFAARDGWHRSIVYRWIASKQIPPHVAWSISLLLERRHLCGYPVEPNCDCSPRLDCIFIVSAR